uniref:Uncharacterized protein n=1 Tax=Hyaloperonospora arabidopsidis (strain Emoy2) TaxID=559515 RepID=M4BST1_HYAAE
MGRVITASRSRLKALAPLIGNYDSAERELTTTEKVEDEENSPALLSHYASAEPDADKSDYMEIKRMLLGTSGAALLRDHHQHTAPDTIAMVSPTTEVLAMDESDPMQIYFAKAMEKFLRDRQRRITRTAQIVRPATNHNVFGACMPDTDMELADSHHSRGNAYNHDDLDIGDLRRLQLATTEATTGGGFASQRIYMSAIAELKEFSVRDHGGDRARGWVRKVESSFLRYQAPDSEKCLVFGDLLISPARNWYSQLSRSTRNKWKDLLESSFL